MITFWTCQCHPLQHPEGIEEAWRRRPAPAPADGTSRPQTLVQAPALRFDAMPPSAASEPIWMGTPKASAYLGVSPRTLYRLIDTGQIPAYRMGHVMPVRPADLDAFLAATQIEPGTLGHLHAGRPAPPWGRATWRGLRPGTEHRRRTVVEGLGGTSGLQDGVGHAVTKRVWAQLKNQCGSNG
jgi:excisionase family DNA binding protein